MEKTTTQDEPEEEILSEKDVAQVIVGEYCEQRNYVTLTNEKIYDFFTKFILF